MKVETLQKRERLEPLGLHLREPETSQVQSLQWRQLAENVTLDDATIIVGQVKIIEFSQARERPGRQPLQPVVMETQPLQVHQSAEGVVLDVSQIRERHGQFFENGKRREVWPAQNRDVAAALRQGPAREDQGLGAGVQTGGQGRLARWADHALSSSADRRALTGRRTTVDAVVEAGEEKAVEEEQEEEKRKWCGCDAARSGHGRNSSADFNTSILLVFVVLLRLYLAFTTSLFEDLSIQS